MAAVVVFFFSFRVEFHEQVSRFLFILFTRVNTNMKRMSPRTKIGLNLFTRESLNAGCIDG